MAGGPLRSPYDRWEPPAAPLGALESVDRALEETRRHYGVLLWNSAPASLALAGAFWLFLHVHGRWGAGLSDWSDVAASAGASLGLTLALGLRGSSRGWCARGLLGSGGVPVESRGSVLSAGATELFTLLLVVVGNIGTLVAGFYFGGRLLSAGVCTAAEEGRASRALSLTWSRGAAVGFNSATAWTAWLALEAWLFGSTVALLLMLVFLSGVLTGAEVGPALARLGPGSGTGLMVLAGVQLVLLEPFRIMLRVILFNDARIATGGEDLRRRIRALSHKTGAAAALLSALIVLPLLIAVPLAHGAPPDPVEIEQAAQAWERLYEELDAAYLGEVGWEAVDEMGRLLRAFGDQGREVRGVSSDLAERTTLEQRDWNDDPDAVAALILEQVELRRDEARAAAQALSDGAEPPPTPELAEALGVYSRPPKEAFDPDLGLVERLRGAANAAREAVEQTLERFAKWLERLLRGRSAPDVRPPTGVFDGISKLFWFGAFVVSGAALVALLYALFRNVGVRRDEGELDGLLSEAARRRPAEWMREARAARDPSEELRLRFLALLSALQRKGRLPAVRARTTGELARALGGADPERAAFATAGRIFDDMRYGGAVPSDDDLERFAAAAAVLDPGQRGPGNPGGHSVSALPSGGAPR